ncbi:MAG TPA: DUF1634 domain-containing protein [Candidatus Limnocylindrales bacterium]|nr:DUF1634 domain-containing protein [Candidatus Limnocylindrales bacterium]
MSAGQTARSTRTASEARALAAERLIGQLLIGVTYVSVGLLAIGVVLMVADSISPTSGGPPLDLSTLGAQLVALEPAAFLWLGMLAVVAAPIGRVIVAAVAYARESDWLMLAISIGILVVITIGVISSVTLTA